MRGKLGNKNSAVLNAFDISDSPLKNPALKQSATGKGSRRNLTDNIAENRDSFREDEIEEEKSEQDIKSPDMERLINTNLKKGKINAEPVDNINQIDSAQLRIILKRILAEKEELDRVAQLTLMSKDISTAINQEEDQFKETELQVSVKRNKTKDEPDAAPRQGGRNVGI